MLDHSARRARGPWRRHLFRGWIAITIAFALFIAVAPLFLPEGRTTRLWLGAPVPFLMIGLTLLGVGWLGWLVTARKRREPGNGPGSDAVPGNPDPG